MNLQLSDRRALVTGSTSGIGAEIARMLAREGVKVVVHGRHHGRAEEVIADIEDKGGLAASALGDLMAPDCVQAVIKTAGQAFGGIDILVNNAGGSNSGAAPGWFEGPIEDWADSFRQNALPAVQLAQAFVRKCATADGVA
jgi:NAD(P)-dependent dehydrogenase (short-subunit alcohol dehydrogenase family)